MADKTDKILKTRAKTHGSFDATATTAYKLKEVIVESVNNGKFTKVEGEALSLICTKIARICNGDPNAVEHWQDIAGYAELVVKDLEF